MVLATIQLNGLSYKNIHIRNWDGSRINKWGQQDPPSIAIEITDSELEKHLIDLGCKIWMLPVRGDKNEPPKSMLTVRINYCRPGYDNHVVLMNNANDGHEITIANSKELMDVWIDTVDVTFNVSDYKDPRGGVHVSAFSTFVVVHKLSDAAREEAREAFQAQRNPMYNQYKGFLGAAAEEPLPFN